MKIIKSAIILFLYILSVNVYAQNNLMSDVNSHLNNLPFTKPKISVPVFPNKNYNVKDYGAKGDGLFLNSESFNKAIKECSAKGGGHVIIPAGVWITGPIIMQNNVDLHLDKGAMVIFTADYNEYPLINSGSNSYAVMNQIYGSKLENSAITGEGIIDGNGQAWRPVRKDKCTEGQWKELLQSGGGLNGDIWWPDKNAAEWEKMLPKIRKSEITKADIEKAKVYYRPYMVYFDKSKNILIEGVTFQNSPKFLVMIKNSDNIVLHNTKAMNEWWAQNGDGLDLSSCKDVLIYDCFVNTGDDAICMKSSGNKRGEFTMENISIDNCTVVHGHGGFTIGSNTDGGIRNICVRNCNFSMTDIGLRFKSRIGGGGPVENIFIDNINMKDIKTEAIRFDLLYVDTGATPTIDDKTDSTKIPYFKNIFINNVICDGAESAFFIRGLERGSIEKITLTNSIIKSKNGLKFQNAHDITLENVELLSQIEPAVYIDQSSNIKFKSIVFSKELKTIVRLLGDKTGGIVFEKIPQISSNSNIELLNGSKENSYKILNNF